MHAQHDHINHPLACKTSLLNLDPATKLSPNQGLNLDELLVRAVIGLAVMSPRTPFPSSLSSSSSCPALPLPAPLPLRFPPLPRCCSSPVAGVRGLTTGASLILSIVPLRDRERNSLNPGLKLELVPFPPLDPTRPMVAAVAVAFECPPVTPPPPPPPPSLSLSPSSRTSLAPLPVNIRTTTRKIKYDQNALRICNAKIGAKIWYRIQGGNQYP